MCSEMEKNLYLDQFRMLIRFSRIRIRKKPTNNNKVGRLKTLHRLAKRVSSASMSTRDSIRLKLQAIIATKFWIYGFDALVFINSVLLVMILAPGGHLYHTALRATSQIFLYLFTVEVITKIFALSFTKFWNLSKMNQLDFVTVTSGVVVNIISFFIDNQNKQAVQFLSISITFIRMIRLLRVLRVLSEFRVVTNTIVHVLPALMRYFAVLLGIFYTYAIVGMELFGNKLDVTKLSYPYNIQLNQSSYVLSEYQRNNFDSIANSFVTLFEQMVVNNWPIVMEGCVASTGYWSVLYFISFYLITVITVMNVLIAFLLDAYQAHKDSFEHQVGMNENFQQDNMHRNHGKEAWLIQLEKVAFNRNIDISAYKLQLKSHVGDVYKAMYGDTDVVESESFSSDVLDDVLNENNIARNSIDLEVEEISAILDDDDGMLFAGEEEDDDDDI